MSVGAGRVVYIALLLEIGNSCQNAQLFVNINNDWAEGHW